MKIGIVLVVLAFITLGCKKKDPTPPPDYTPAKVVLAFPTKDEACTTGTNQTATQNLVTFSWNGATNAESYELDIRNLATGVAFVPIVTTNTQLGVTISRNTPYSWYIISKSSKTAVTIQSDIWKFYNSGPGVVSHAPFPADNLAPYFGQNITANAGKISLSWTGSDVDNDIANYDVYFGVTSSPALLQDHFVGNIITNVGVTTNTTYYWKVTTRDATGNTSDSGVYQFKVN